jgi:hypothetical protein
VTARNVNPVDFTISFAGGPTTFEVHLKEHEAGEARKAVMWEGLDALASEYGGLATAGAGLPDLVRLGRRLFDHIFHDAEAVLLFGRASDNAKREERPLRVLIELSHGSSLQKIPWEILFDGKRFLAKDPRCSVVRYFHDGQEVPSFQVEPPLRILLTSASPPTQPDLNLEAEVAAVRRVYNRAKNLVLLKVERNVSLDRLKNLWWGAEKNKRPFHVWHHCGHGHLDEGEPFELTLENQAHAEYVTVDQLSEIIGICPGLKLAVINVCHGGSLVGLAPELARINVPVVIGFPNEIGNDTAREFAALLHGGLLQVPVEFAVSQARKLLRAADGMDLEWSKPLLFSRRRDSGTILRLPDDRPMPPDSRLSKVEKEKVNSLLAKLSNALGEGGRHEG